MYRMFIREQKKERIDRIDERGGGYVPAEILVCHDFESAVPDPEERKQWNEIVWKPNVTQILELSNGKEVFIDGKEFTTDEAHEIIIKLTGTWGTDFEKQELKDAALGLSRDCQEVTMEVKRDDYTRRRSNNDNRAG